MRLRRHANRRISDPVCDLCQCVSGTGADDQCLQRERGSERFGTDDGMNDLSAGKGLHLFPQSGGASEPGVRRPDRLTHDRLDLVTGVYQLSDLPHRLGMGTEGAADGIS